MDFKAITDSALATITQVGLKVIGAIVLYIIGRYLVSFAVSLVSKGLERQHVEPTLLSYLSNTIAALLNIVLVVAILGFFGIETTSFAALLAAAGIAIGAAWAGLLANFAAGVFLVILRPFKTGDFVSVAGQTGTVRQIGLFATTIVTPDNVVTLLGNNRIFSETIQNFSTNPYRRVDLVAQLNGSVDHNVAIALLKTRLAAIPNVIKDPAPDVEILQFTLVGPVLAVRPYCHTDHYWQVYFDSNKLIREAFGEAGFPAPEPSYLIRTVQAKSATA